MKSVKILFLISLILSLFVCVGCSGEATPAAPEMPIPVKVPKKYEIIVYDSWKIKHGTLSVDKETAEAGETVTITLTPENGYRVSSITAKISNNRDVQVDGTDNVRTIVMPSEILLVTATFEKNYLPLTINTKDYPFVTFGQWPQTKLYDPNISVDEENSKVVGLFTYYKGNDEAWYAKVESSYYKVEPIKWKNVTKDYNGTGKTFLMAENILDVCKYFDVQFNRKISGETVYPNNYRHSRIRAYLNGRSYHSAFVNEAHKLEEKNEQCFAGKGFLQTAFTIEERNWIELTSVLNNARSTFWSGSKYDDRENIYASDIATEDEIFLLSMQEITNPEFGFQTTLIHKTSEETEDDERLQITYTDFAKANGLEMIRGETLWWLRSPAENSASYARCIYTHEGNSSSWIDFNYGVVPAFCLK